MISDLRKNTDLSVSVVNSVDTIVISSHTPVTILSGQIDLTTPSKIHISGVINGTFSTISGLAVYVDDVPIHLGTGSNFCHPDCMQIMFGGNLNNRMRPIPFDVSTGVLGAGVHEVRIGVLSRWKGGRRTMFVNNREGADGMSSSSTLTLRVI